MGSDFTIGKKKHIKYILDNFDFVKVNDIMKKLDWCWFGTDGVPTIDILKRQASDMLNDIYDSDYTTSSTGGFEATKFEDHLELKFIISDWSSYSVNYIPEYNKLKEIKTRKRKLNIIQKLNDNEDN